MSNENLDFNTKYNLITKKFALVIIKLIQTHERDFINDVLLKQLLRSSTSVAANFRAVSQSRSVKERFAKLSLVIEELDESLFWMEMLVDANIVAVNKDINSIKQEGIELLKVFSSYRKKLRESLQTKSYNS